MHFTEYLNHSIGSREAVFARKILESFALPLPQAGEFYATNAHSQYIRKALVFLDSHDVIFRFYESCEIPQHDHILQPLAKQRMGDMHWDVVPLHPTSVSEEDCDLLTDILFRDGIAWGDSHIDNAGYLPLANHPVVFDVCRSLEEEGTWREATDKVLCQVQNTFYAPLKEAANNCFKNDVPPRSAAKDFLTACHTFKKKNHPEGSYLQNSFLAATDRGQTEKAVKAAQVYAQRLTATRPEYRGLEHAATMRCG